MNGFLKFLGWLSMFTLAIVGGSYFFSDYVLQRPLLSSVLISIIYFYTTTLILHTVLISAGKGRPQQFVTAFMGALSIKLFLSMGILVVYVYLNREELKEFALFYLLFYLLFTAFETVYIIRALKSVNKDDA